ncbi:MAG: DUF4143 domain-containing protein [Pontimonas sp.]|nr:DUF4143 domain-containing protein [Pontimonas sp.]
MEYRRRLIDDVLDDLMVGLPALAVEGAKAVGKTATATQRAKTTLSLNDPRTREVVAANADLITQLDPPVFIDEWQLEPSVWDRVRRAVDDEPGARGRFLLAGSAAPSREARIHSGAGRIVRLMMRPLSFVERGISAPTVSLRDLHKGGLEIAGETPIRLGEYVDEILRSGFPGIRELEAQYRDRALDGYLERIVDSDLPDAGVRVRRPQVLMGWLKAYAAATATSAEYSKILDAATPGESDKPARATVAVYQEHLERLFILDPLEAWQPTFVPLARLTGASQHHLVDPALAARLVGVGRAGLLVGEGDRVSGATGSWLGALFESLVVQSLRVYADTANTRVGHLRTKGGEREVDLISEGAERDCVAIEVKLADTVGDHDVRHLLWLKEKLGPRLKDAIVVNTGPYAYRRRDGIGVVPFALLGP